MKLLAAFVVLLAVGTAAAADPAPAANAGKAPSSASSASTTAPAAAVKSGACEAVKSESCALCDHLADPTLGCGLASTLDVLSAVNAAVGPDVGMYSVYVDEAAKACSVEVDMPNEGGSGGDCRLIDGVAYAVAKCPVGKIPTGLSCVAVDEEGSQSTPVKGTTQATMLHTVQCGFPYPFPAPFAGQKAVIVMACQPVELGAAQAFNGGGKKKAAAAPPAGARLAAPATTGAAMVAQPSLEVLMRLAGRGARAKAASVGANYSKAGGGANSNKAGGGANNKASG